MKKILIMLSLVIFIYLSVQYYKNNKLQIIPIKPDSPLNISYMRSQKYSGSDIKIEETLSSGSNYKRYIVSFKSDGLKEYAYMTIPTTQKPSNGFPVIIFNHGYQIPKLYTPDGNYIAYMDTIARSGYIIFKPDYRGNGKSEGNPGSTYFSPNYHIDVLNAIASIKKIRDPQTSSVLVDSNRIGVWGHSMGGNIALRVSEISLDIKAVVIWGGVVGNYQDIIYNWQDRVSYKLEALDLYLRNLGLSQMLAINSTPIQNPTFWNSIDPTTNLNYINAPFQIHVGLSDNQVPPNFSKFLSDKMNKQGKFVEYYEYPGANHDINQSFDLAMKRTIEFFDHYLK